MFSHPSLFKQCWDIVQFQTVTEVKDVKKFVASMSVSRLIDKAYVELSTEKSEMSRFLATAAEKMMCLIRVGVHVAFIQRRKVADGVLRSAGMKRSCAERKKAAHASMTTIYELCHCSFTTCLFFI